MQINLWLTFLNGVFASLAGAAPMRKAASRVGSRLLISLLEDGAPSAQAHGGRALRQFLVKAALIEFSDRLALQLVAFVKEG